MKVTKTLADLREQRKLIDSIIEPPAGNYTRMSDAARHQPTRNYQPSSQRSTEPRKSSGAILVVDDNQAILTLVKSFLEIEGYTVLMAADAETAMKLYDRSKVALLLTDVVMPDMSGLELADQLLQREPELRILFMSGSAEASRGFGCVAKPFTGDGLIRRVGEALQGLPTTQFA
jgi:CheY-like chemotaxis protein